MLQLYPNVLVFGWVVLLSTCVSILSQLISAILELLMCALVCALISRRLRHTWKSGGLYPENLPLHSEELMHLAL